MLKQTVLPLVVAFAALSHHGFAQDRTPQPPQNPAQPGQANDARDQPGSRTPGQAQEGRAFRPEADARTAADSRSDMQAHIANCLILGNQEEIALSRFALQRTQNEKVRQFSQQMIDDHTQFVRDLQRFTSNPPAQLREGSLTAAPGRANPDASAGAADAANPNQPRQPGAATPRDQSAATADANRPQDPNRPQTRTAARPIYDDTAAEKSGRMQFEVQAAEECLRLTQQDLSKHQGSDFDMAYLGVQLGMHNGMLAKLKAAQSHTNGELQALIQKGQQTAQQHKQHAEQLKQELKGASASNSERTGTAAPGSDRSANTPDRRTPERPATPLPGSTSPRVPQ